MADSAPDVTVIEGDCLEVLATLDRASIAAVITDPPYGIAHKSHGQLFKDAIPIDGDEDDSLACKLAEWADDLPLAMFFSPYRPLPIAWRSVLCWDKGGHVGIGGDRRTCWKRDFEMIGVRNNGKLSGGRDSAMLRFMAVLPPPSGHFCEKPLPLMAYLVKKLTRPGDLVLDPFAGSGTTGIACMKAGRRCILIEKDPKYLPVIHCRIAEARTPLFDLMAKGGAS